MGATATDLKLTIHPHPTLTETLMESAEVFFGMTHVSFTPALTTCRALVGSRPGAIHTGADVDSWSKEVSMLD
jgi:hypothetical protein